MPAEYESPLCKRYAGKEMLRIFSDDNKFSTWRRLWVTLAESQKELGLNISQTQIDEMKSNIYDIDFEKVSEYERKTRHDVMAHILAFGELCPEAKPIIHLGATSCYVGDNADIIIQKEALLRLKKLLVNTMEELRKFAGRYKSVPCLAYTHFQPAQPVTFGKRAALWLQDLLLDSERLDFTISGLKPLGCKGATGTAASFLALFDGDYNKVKALDKKIAEKSGFEKAYSVSGQTYSRKADYNILSALSGIAQSAYKFSNDIRLLSHLKEVDEPFEEGQIGSSAMAYKRNPMRSERMASLSRYVMINALNPALTASSQWFERTLDDSANRRISIPEAFLAVDGILSLYINIIRGLTIYPKIAEKHLAEELPFIATENILMHCVRKGGDRQALHERIRIHSVRTAENIKRNGKENDLLQRILADPAFDITAEELDGVMEIKNFTGCSEMQTEDFLAEVESIIEINKDLLGVDAEINV